MELVERLPDRGRVVGRRDDARPRLPDQLGSRAVGRHRGEDGPPHRDVLEHLPGEDTAAAAVGLGDEQQQRLRVALEGERRRARCVRAELEAVAEPEALGPLAIGGAEVAQEPCDDVQTGVVERL